MNANLQKFPPSAPQKKITSAAIYGNVLDPIVF